MKSTTTVSQSPAPEGVETQIKWALQLKAADDLLGTLINNHDTVELRAILQRSLQQIEEVNA